MRTWLSCKVSQLGIVVEGNWSENGRFRGTLKIPADPKNESEEFDLMVPDDDRASAKHWLQASVRRFLQEFRPLSEPETTRTAELKCDGNCYIWSLKQSTRCIEITIKDQEDAMVSMMQVVITPASVNDLANKHERDHVTIHIKGSWEINPY